MNHSHGPDGGLEGGAGIKLHLTVWCVFDFRYFRRRGAPSWIGRRLWSSSSLRHRTRALSSLPDPTAPPAPRVKGSGERSTHFSVSQEKAGEGAKPFTKKWDGYKASQWGWAVTSSTGNSSVSGPHPPYWGNKSTHPWGWGQLGDVYEALGAQPGPYGCSLRISYRCYPHNASQVRKLRL